MVSLESCAFDIGQTDKTFFGSFADLSHARYYLSGTARLPRFGLGQYQCADLDQTTGKKR
ncbi:MAG: hypothetical protein LBB21_01185 [Holosporaceae bacterium]|jgi:hypothetical protein|nr:hypothetical protein [Holosporaceae bacterium]